MSAARAPSDNPARTWTHEALDAIGAGVIVFDGSGRIFLANPRAASILGRTVADLQDRRVDEVLAPVAQLLAPNAGPERGQLEVTLADGRRFSVGYSITTFVPSQAGTDEKHHVCLFQDISIVTRLREERDRLLQLAALGSLMPPLLHELRNPLAAISTTTELLLEEHPAASARDDLLRILEEVQRINLISQRLRGMDEVGRPLRTQQPADAAGAIVEVIDLLRPTAERNGARLLLDSADLPPLPLEPSVLRSITLNLVTNAVEACAAGGQIQVRARHYRGQLFELSVEDDGKGMSDEVLARCTDLFFTTKRRGSGLGLTLCRQAAEAASGSLTIRSRPGSGTCAVLSIPLGEGAIEPRAPARGATKTQPHGQPRAEPRR